MKKGVLIGILLVSMMMLVPSFAYAGEQTFDIDIKEQAVPLDPPLIRPIGAFRISIYPPTEPFERLETREIQGVHQLIPGAIELLLPTLWMYQYSVLECVDTPDWLEVTLITNPVMTPPDGVEYNFSIQLTLRNDAPANAVGTVSFDITTGKFMRTMFPHWFPLCNEFNLGQEFVVCTGDW